ncbi:glutamate receptor 4-like [Penaeus monodon]|uniref:glutamate receptor 4-like n=1 Tax=Penaeus monodon TaxID=6687 RepID=UPI0018A6E52D|nr:glutamate receptor 4-like [Penaeus monodon]
MSVGVVFVARPSAHVSVYNFLFSFAGAFAQQGSEVVPPCPRGRTAFFTLWIGSVLVYTSYTARLTSQLAVVYTQEPFSSLTEALTTAGFLVAAQKGTAYITAMESARDEGLKLLYETLQSNPSLLVQNNTEALELLQKSKRKIAFFQDVNSVNYNVKGDCGYTWYGEDYFPEYVYLGYRKNLSFANAFSYFIIKASDTGITPKLIKKWWGSSSSCASTSPFQDLGFSKTVSAFVLLALGILSGFLFLLAELSLHWLRPRRRRSLKNAERLAASMALGSAPRRKKTGTRGDSHRFAYEPHLRHL